MKTLLGLDPGSQYTGFGVLQLQQGQVNHLQHGVLSLNKAKTFAGRLYLLHLQLEEVISRWRPHEVVVEKVFLGPNVDSAFKLGHARGVCLGLAAKFGCTIKEMAPRAVKKSVTSYGAASKDQVALAVSSWLKIDTQGVCRDATDALALAIARALLVESEERVAQMMAENP